MHTGYESFWIYENNRQEVLHYLQKNDQYSQAVTDSNKQAQNGGLPCPPYNYVSPQNNVVSCHRNIQHKATGPQCIWPSSVYVLPAKSSQMNNFHPQEAFSNNPTYTFQNTQAQQNYRSSYYRKPYVNVTHMYSSHNKNQSNSVIRNKESATVQTPRIRVKDVFSLNNNCLSDSLLSNNLYQPPSEVQNGCALNYDAVPHNRVSVSEAQIEFRHIPVGNPPDYYEATEPPQPIYQPQSTFYQQNSGNKFHLIDSRQTDKNFPVDPSKTSTHSNLLKKILSGRNKKVSNAQKAHRETHFVNKRPQNTSSEGPTVPDRPNQGLTFDSSNVGNVSFVQNFHQNNTSVANAVSGSSTHSQVFPNRLSSSYVPVTRQDNNLVKISIPHTGEHTFISLNDSCSTSDRPNLSLPSLSETSTECNAVANNNEFISDRNRVLNFSLPQIAQENSINPPASTVASQISSSSISTSLANSEGSPSRNPSTVQRNVPPKEPFIRVIKENLNKFLNSNPKEMTSKEGNVEKEIAFQTDIMLNALNLKQENFEKRTESHIILEDGFPGAFDGIIKTEINDADIPETDTRLEFENQTSENAVQGVTSPVDEETQNATEVSIRLSSEIIKESRTTSSTEDKSLNWKNQNSQVDTENTVRTSNKGTEENPKVETARSTGKKNEKNCRNKSSLGNKFQRPTSKIKNRKKNYRSKINRQKLDMLIQFLKKDEDPMETERKTAVTKKLIGGGRRKKEKEDLNRNRRKLSKSSIVKNKNNSREMVSLMSPKSFRVDHLKNSSGISETVKTNIDLEKTEKEENNSKINESLKSDSPAVCQASESESNISSGVFNEEGRETLSEEQCAVQGEEKLLSSIREFRNLRTSVCKSCNSASSVDSFWINVATGEVKCVNCFMTGFGTGKNNLGSGVTSERLKGNPLDNSSGVGPSSSGKAEENCVKETKQETKKTEEVQAIVECINQSEENSGKTRHEASESKQQNRTKEEKMSGKEVTKRDQSTKKTNSKDENHIRKSKLPEENSKSKRKEEDESEKSRNLEKSGSSAKSNRKSVGKEDCGALKGNSNTDSVPEKSDRRNSWREDNASQKSGNNVETSRKDEIDHRKSSSKDCTGYKVQVSEDTTNKSMRRTSKEEENASKKEKKEVDSVCRGRRNSIDVASHKSLAVETHARKYSVDLLEKSPSRTKESCNLQKSLKYSTLEKSKVSIPSKECHKPRAEHTKPKESNSGNEFRPKTSSIDLEKCRKRKISSEDFGACQKIRVVEDSKGDKQVMLCSERTKGTIVSKEDILGCKNKFLNGEKQFSRYSTDKKVNFSREGEKHTKHSSDLTEKSKTKDVVAHEKTKAIEHTKQKIGGGSVDISRRKSRDDGGVQKPVISKDGSSEVLEKQGKKITKDDLRSPKAQHGYVPEKELKPRENKEKKQSERKERKQFLGKIPKISKTNVEQPQKSDAGSKPLKEHQLNKITSEKLKNNGSHEDRRDSKRKGEEKHDEKYDKKTQEKGTIREEKNKKEKKEVSLYRKKERLDGKFYRSQTENKHLKVSIGNPIGERKMDENRGSSDCKQSHTLLEKLIEKTKKLTWSLLNEA